MLMMDGVFDENDKYKSSILYQSAKTGNRVNFVYGTIIDEKNQDQPL